jgi:hypothetical protein
MLWLFGTIHSHVRGNVSILETQLADTAIFFLLLFLQVCELFDVEHTLNGKV